MTNKNDKKHSKPVADEPIELVFTVHQELAQESAQSLAGTQDDDKSLEGDSPSNDVNGTSSQNSSNLTPVAPVIINNSEIDVMEAQVKLIALYASEAKLLEAQMNKLIKGAYSKAPQAKPYLLQMKKSLRDFSQIQSILDKAKDLNTEIIKNSPKKNTEEELEADSQKASGPKVESGKSTGPKLVKDLELEIEETSISLSTEGLKTKDKKAA